MSIIQDIRDKYAKVAVVAIALALVGFILTDYLKDKERRGGGRGSSSLGSVNGRAVDAKEFDAYVNAYSQNQNDPEAKYNAVGNAWSVMVEKMLIEKEADKIGISVGKKEKGDIFFGPNAPSNLKQPGTDPVTAKKQIEQYLKSSQVTAEQKEQLRMYMNQLVEGRASEKFNSLFYKSSNVPRWMVEKQIADNSLIAKASLVKAQFTDSVFRDTTVKVSDKDIEDYIGKHKDDFKQPESRSIDFVTFSASATSADSVAVRSELASLKKEFDTTKEIKMFLQRNGSDYQDAFVSPSQLSPSGKDSITRLAKNAVFGPYLEGDGYLLVKLLDTKVLPDSARAKHILVQTNDPRAQQQLLDDSVGKKRIDSIFLALKNGANFDSLAKRFSDDNKTADGGSAAKGGDMGWFAYGSMVPEFNDFSFEKPVGTRDIVKTSFGYHIIEVTGQKSPQTKYKVAYLRKKISPSDQTQDVAQQAANDFAGKVSDIKSFDAEYQKSLKPKGINKGIGKNISRNSGSASQQIGFSRSFVRAIYDAKNGEVLKPAKVGENWVVAVVTETFNEGTQSAAAARPYIEPMLRNKKKAELLKQKLGKVSSLQAAASILGTPVITVDSLRMTVGAPMMNVPYDPKLFGAIFNAANKGKLLADPIVGDMGIYVVQPENITASPAGNTNVADMRKQQAAQVSNNQIGALKLSANIKDKKSAIY